MIKANVNVRNIEGFVAAERLILKAIDSNLKGVARTVRNEAKNTSRFADKTGTLRKRIKMRKSKFDEGGYVVEARAPHAHLIEYGHKKVLWGNRTPGFVPGRKFMRVALEKGITEAVRVFRSR